MPCGGIYPLTDDHPFVRYYWPGTPGHECLVCGKYEPRPDHFCDEWDGYLHGKCVVPFLNTEMGRTVLEHEHNIMIQLEG